MTSPGLPPPTDEEIRKEFEGKDFGPRDPIMLCKNGLLQVCCGYGVGYTLAQILKHLELVTVKYIDCGAQIKLTDRGRHVCYLWHKGD
jgi:hypothetical protein